MCFPRIESVAGGRVRYACDMKTATITEAKTRLSALIDEVRTGETIVITDNGVPVARLVPETGPAEDDEARLARLERRGGISRPTRPPLTLEELPEFPPDAPPSGVLEELLAEREESW